MLCMNDGMKMKYAFCEINILKKSDCLENNTTRV